MTLRAVVLLLLLVASTTYSQRSHSQHVPSFVYGRWTIFKFVEVNGHAGQTKEKAKAQIGKTVTLGVKSLAHDKKFLWFDDACKNVSYKMEEPDREDGSLGFYGLEQQESGQFLLVSCDGRDSYFFELAKNQELAVYYDGWFFFLRKSTGIGIVR